MSRDLGQGSLHVAQEKLLVVRIREGLIDQLTVGHFFAGNQGSGSISLILRVKLLGLSRAQLPGLLTADGLDARFFVDADNANILLTIIPGSQVQPA